MIAPNQPMVLILAGGEGLRMGGDKPQRRLAGKRLIDHALSLASRWSDAPVVALRSPGQVDLADAKVIIDDAGIEGPLGGLVAGLSEAQRTGFSRILSIPADMPFLPDDLAARLTVAIDDGEKSRAAIACSGGRLHPICGLWSIGCARALPAYLSTGRLSLRGFAAAVGYVAVDWEIANADPFANINDPESLARAEDRLRA